jgi:DNA repair protein RAD5
VSPLSLYFSQWQTEVKKFAPHLSVLTLHNADNPTVQAVASADIVIASTFLLQQTGRANGSTSTGVNKKMINFLRRIHWHRILTDESHLNQQGSKTKQVLASLSATHRFCITGTPLGGQLSDFYGQLRFLRIAPFHREDWWKNNIEAPYHEHNPEALRVLRSLLSRVVMRHSKEQTQENGRALLALPPRSVDTELISFGSESEKAVYEAIENRNRSRFMDLKKESTKTVASKYLELNGMLVSARQACVHVSLIDLQKYHRLNSKLAYEKWEAEGKKKKAPVNATTRAGVLEAAVERARHSAKSRMRLAIMQFQHGDCEMLGTFCEIFENETVPVYSHHDFSCFRCRVSCLSRPRGRS